MQELQQVTPQQTEVVESTISAPKKWGMSTPQGNQVLERKAETLINNVAKIKEKNGRAIDYLPHFQKFFDSYESSIINNANCKEAKNDSVKDKVWSFANEVGEAVDLSKMTLSDLWNSRIAKVRKKKN